MRIKIASLVEMMLVSLSKYTAMKPNTPKQLPKFTLPFLQ